MLTDGQANSIASAIHNGGDIKIEGIDPQPTPIDLIEMFGLGERMEAMGWTFNDGWVRP